MLAVVYSIQKRAQINRFVFVRMQANSNNKKMKGKVCLSICVFLNSLFYTFPTLPSAIFYMSAAYCVYVPTI